MKPVKLTIEGINSFIEPQTLDFEAVGRNNLFCISGKTGAGKTTIFDSILFALYGKSSKGNIADTVNLSCMSARVELDFEANGEMYSVERTIKCRYEKDADKKPTDKRLCVTDCTLSKFGQPLAKGDAATSLTKEIVGLEDDEFKNVYLLEQGEYADFLKKTPTKQNEVVGKIFSLLRFGDVYKLAAERYRTENEKVATAEKRMAEYGDITAEKLRAEKNNLTQIRSKNTTLQKSAELKREELAALEKVRDAYISAQEKQKNVKNLMFQADESKKTRFFAENVLAEFERSIDPEIAKRIEKAREELNKLSALNTLDREYDATVKLRDDKLAELDRKKAKLAEARSQYERLSARAEEASASYLAELDRFNKTADGIAEKSEGLLAAQRALTGEDVTDVTAARFSLEAEKKSYTELLARKRKAEKELADRTSACSRLLETVERFTESVREFAKKRDDARAERERAEKALADARLCSYAASVRAELADGDICPVCGGVYCGHGTENGADVEAAKAAFEAAVKTEKQAEAGYAERDKHLDRAKAEYDGAKKDKEAAAREAEEVALEVEACRYFPDVYEELFSILDRAKAAGDGLRAAKDEKSKREPQLTELSVALAGAESAAKEAATRADDLRLRLGEDCGRTDAAIAAVKTELADAEKRFAEIELKRKKFASEAEKARAAAETVQRSLEAAQAECPVDLPQFDEDDYRSKKEEADRIATQMADSAKELGAAELTVKMMSENFERVKAIAAEKALYAKQADIYAVITDLTKGKAMLNYVAAEYIAEFTAVAGEILSDLSGGKYMMSYDRANGFTVSDYLNGGKSRKTDTLSGGELFLASLSVAIAIARTQSKGNNAFFFLDEGFGTLDDELIETVYGALESLSRDCLVGVITHASSLIERMPARVEVIEATDEKGSVIKY